MIELGKIQTLEVERITPIGVYINTHDQLGENDILLPRKQVPEGTEVGDKIEVFVYRDSEDRMIATVNKPKITLGEIALLEVKETTRIGAFLDWGLEKDLLLPFKQQTCKVHIGKSYLVSLYVDKSDRLCATMDIYDILRSDSPYKVDDHVQGIIYSIKRNMGALIAIDNKYHGLIPKHELYGNHDNGETVKCRVVKVREDGKLYLSIRQKAYKQMDEDAKILLDKLEKNNGFLAINDKSSPIQIKKELDMSKNAFKRAVGRLLKNKKITIKDNGIQLLNHDAN